ncbi:M67 family metallopeptidase [Paenibacillus sp. FSL W8-0186]|uniref:JAB domain-containing protein n=1 Tax=Paenibacillus woosongensis TaxID=307580 RepID=A0ABQ4MLG0_9BACL|nr:M67 family metallopeptidase [Paenibacillus woosongensis]GIP56822.1 hypothetical protein J15TS10_06360 [Paenibacillus woosongensis]
MNDYFRKQVSEPRRIILPSVYKQLEQDSLTRYPHEACGILLGEIAAGAVVIDGYVPVTNASAQPDRHFSLDPQEWVKHSYHPKLLGLFHSHPTAPPVPSAADLRELPLFASLLKLYVIGSCCNIEPAAGQTPGNNRPSFSLQGYEIISSDSNYRLESITFDCIVADQVSLF